MKQSNKEEKICALLEKGIETKLRSALLMLISNCYEMSDIQIVYEQFDKPSDFDVFERTIQSYILELDKIIDEENSEQYVQKLSDLRQDIVDATYSVSLYLDMLNTVQTIVMSEHHQKNAKVSKERTLNREAFLTFCQQFLDHPTTEDPIASQKMNMANLLSSFPIKMTKEKYFDYIEHSIADQLDNGDTDFIPLIKKLFLPSADEHYGKYFESLKTELDELLQSDWTTKSEEEIDEQIETLEFYEDDLSAVLDHLSVLHESVNFILLLTIFVPNLDPIFGEDLLLKDLYYTIKDSGFTEDLSLFRETTSEKLADMTERAVDSTLQIEVELEKLLSNKKTDSFSDDLQTLLFTSTTASALYYGDLSHEPLRHSKQANTQEDKKTVIKNLVSQIRCILEGFAPKKQRILRQAFLAYLPCPWSVHEFMDYITYSLESCTNEQALFTMLLAEGYFINSGFIDPDDDAHEHQHEHDCDCGCS